MNFTEYAQIDAVNASTLKELANKSPRHYQWLLSHPHEETAAMRFGTAVHAAVLEPDKFAKCYVGAPRKMDYRKTDDKQWRDEQLQSGRIILDVNDAEKIDGIVSAIQGHPFSRDLLKGGETELTLLWTDETTGIPCKGRCDLLTGNGTILVDLKTTTDIRRNEFMRKVLNYGYALSMAFYVDGLQAQGYNIEHVYLLAVETSGPFDVAPYELDDNWLELGRAQYQEALEKLAACRERNVWPGMVPSRDWLPFPKWAVPDEEKDALDGLEFDGGEE